MEGLSKSQKARAAIAAYKTLADACILRGSYGPAGITGRKLEDALRQFNPEIYGSMSDPRIVELKGLEYVIDRLPRTIERCTKIVLTAQEDLEGTSFEAVRPFKRRRLSYIVSDTEICFVVTRGATEIYDILTHLTFLNIEARKIKEQVWRNSEEPCQEWQELERLLETDGEPQGADLDKAIWNLSIILGRTYKETRQTYEYLERQRINSYNSGLFAIVYSLGRRYMEEMRPEVEKLSIHFTPSLQDILGHQRYASTWAMSIKRKIIDLGLHTQPIHIISANMHSCKNILYGRGALKIEGKPVPEQLYEMVREIRDNDVDVDDYARQHGFCFHADESGSNIDVQIVDTSRIDPDSVHPQVSIAWEFVRECKPVVVVMDYAFGAQAYEVMDELLSPADVAGVEFRLNIESISIMGKAGILPGTKGDIMLATAHVMEGTPHNYILDNDLHESDFSGEIPVYSGPMVTVLGTSLQNRDVLDRFHSSSWKAIGLEMEGGHYQRAINAAIIQGHIPKKMKVRYAYYASDNPLLSGQTLASGPMGAEGVVPTYLITRIILEKIFRMPDET